MDITTKAVENDVEKAVEVVEPEVEVKKVTKSKLLILVPRKRTIIPLVIAPPSCLIRVGQRQMRKCYPSADGFVQIPAWSGGKSEFRELSPFFLGPFELDGIMTENFENGWQHLKAYQKHLDKANNDYPNAEWHRWRLEGFQEKKAIRHPMAGEKPLYCFYKGQKLDVVEARRQVYIPFYMELVRKTTAYKALLHRLKAGEKLLIIEPDGPNLYDFQEGLEFDRELFKKLISVTDQKSFYALIPGKAWSSTFNKYFALGHGYVLADALLEDLEKV